jgi:hypothetical protein
MCLLLKDEEASFFSETSVIFTKLHEAILVNNLLDAQFFSCVFISILYMFRTAMCPSSGELIVSVRHLVHVTLCRWDCFAVSSKPAQQTVIYTEWHVPDVGLISLILLMMGTWLPETCREYKLTYMKKNCASSWLITRAIPRYTINRT